MALYDRLGRTYTRTRDTDPRLAAVIWAALGDARTVVNVGACTGSYEPPDRELTAVEPSEVMIAQRPHLDLRGDARRRRAGGTRAAARGPRVGRLA
jgi:hypothetical protein